MRNLAGLFCLLCMAANGSAADADANRAIFVRRVAPLLQEKCVACHGGNEEEIEGGLDLRSGNGLKAGGDSGESLVVAGQSHASPLYLAMTRTHADWSPMPPKEAERLSETQLEWVREWIDGGAEWPAPDAMQTIRQQHADAWSAEDGVVVATSGGLSEAWNQRKYKTEGLWAYQPIVEVAPPRNDRQLIDAWIDHQRPPELPVAPAASRTIWIRRATFDLTGLPPTPEAIDAFLADPAPDSEARRTVIDRLLESPHYGERMAQHWLDVVRYADSSGFANDFERGNAWRYRDYVVRSFNDDKPYDRFVMEQIAGDELSPDDSEAVIATGFLRMGPWELTGMEVAKVARQRFLDDVTNSIGETFLAHSLQCARCHDHKFDPVPTRDYYRIQAVFATTQLAERSAPFQSMENTRGFEEREFLLARREEHLKTLEALDRVLLENASQWFEEKGLDPGTWNQVVQEVTGGERNGKKAGYDGIFNAARQSLLKQGAPEKSFPPKLVGFTPEQFGLERVARKGLERLKWELDRYEPFALAVYNGRTPDQRAVTAPIRIPEKPRSVGELEEACILIGGDPFSRGDPVDPGALSVLPGESEEGFTKDIDGRRSALARWIARSDNPLTVRTIVNRIWSWHFDQPLAGNPNNFGSTGKRPTHPELLDALSTAFVRDGWSFKSMHRRIMTSEAYARSSIHPDPQRLVELDPLGTSYAVFKPRRLTAEELRDAMLVATGEWNPVLGGIPNRPEMNLEAALQPRQVMGTFAAAWTPNPLPEQRHRRSLYALKLRGLRDPLLEVFNAPAPDFSCERREASTVTPQVFSLFNSIASHTRALALAHRLSRANDRDEDAIIEGYRRVFGRVPHEEELRVCLDHWNAMENRLPEQEAGNWRPPLSIRREAVEENTGEKFAFDERLHAYQDFVPDLQPADVDRRTRALADVCLVWFNCNEFVYVD